MKTRLAKITTGEIVIGIDTDDGIRDVAIVQLNQTDGDISISVAPFGIPFDDGIAKFIPNSKVVYEISNIPTQLEETYANLKLAKNKQLIYSIILAYLLQAKDNSLEVEQIAKILNIDIDLANSFLNELENENLVVIKDKVVTLTDSGIDVAKNVTYNE